MKEKCVHYILEFLLARLTEPLDKVCKQRNKGQVFL